MLTFPLKKIPPYNMAGAMFGQGYEIPAEETVPKNELPEDSLGIGLDARFDANSGAGDAFQTAPELQAIHLRGRFFALKAEYAGKDDYRDATAALRVYAMHARPDGREYDQAWAFALGLYSWFEEIELGELGRRFAALPALVQAQMEARVAAAKAKQG